MSKSSGVILGLLGVGLVAFFVALLYSMSVLNNEARLRTDFHAQQQANESSFDKTWKVIKQQIDVAEHERDSFRETYTEIMSETQGVAGKGELASFFTQAKVDVTPELFSKVMTTIEAQRESFHRDQQKLLQLEAEQHKCFEVQPSGTILAIFGRDERVDASIVTSSKTKDTFETGEENDVDLFNDNK